LVAVLVLLQDLVLGGLAVALGFDGLAVEHCRDLLDVGGSDRALLGVGDQEFEVEMAVGHGVLVVGQPQSLGSLQLLVVQDLTGRGGNDVLLAVQVLDLHRHSGQSF
jgi:hypothetical protein